MERRERQDSNLRFRRNQPAFYRLNYTPVKAVARRTWTTARDELPAPKCSEGCLFATTYSLVAPHMQQLRCP